MDPTDFEISIECPNCGEVTMCQKEFVSASFDNHGNAKLSFGCPSCDAMVELRCRLSTRALKSLTSFAISSLGDLAPDNHDRHVPGGPEGGLPVSNGRDHDGAGRGDEHGRGDERGREGEPSRESTAARGNGAGREGAAGGEGGAGREGGTVAKAPDGSRLNIRYMPLGGGSVINFGVSFGVDAEHGPGQGHGHGPGHVHGHGPGQGFGQGLGAQRVGLRKAGPDGSSGYRPTTEDEAKLEYFHRQLESLDTVDDAIDEIDSGYNFSDDFDDGEESQG